MRDAYAAALHGAVYRIDPRLRVVDGTHGVAPGDVLAAAYHAKALALAFGPGTVVCAVVDPGVGSGRGAVAADCAGVRCVAPDTGAATYLWAEAPAQRRACVRLATPPEATATFHGRDLFAPVAARLAAGAALRDCGSPHPAPLLVEEAFVRRQGSVLSARVAVVDHFGNAITTLRRGDVGAARVLRAAWPGGASESLARTYAEAGPGPVLVWGSTGHLEVAASGRPVAAVGGPALGAQVRIEVEGG